MVGNGLVCRCNAGPGIHHEENNIGFFNGLQALLGHMPFNALFTTINTACIDNNEFPLIPTGLPIFAIPRQTGKVGHQCIPATGKPVKKGGLAHIRTSHQSHNRS